MFGIKATKDCACSACAKLREVSPAARIGQGAAVAVMAVLCAGTAGLIGSLIVWGVVSVLRQL